MTEINKLARFKAKLIQNYDGPTDPLTDWGRAKQARKLKDAQAEKLTSWEAHKLANWQADKSTTDKLTSWNIDKLTSWRLTDSKADKFAMLGSVAGPLRRGDFERDQLTNLEERILKKLNKKCT